MKKNIFYVISSLAVFGFVNPVFAQKSDTQLLAQMRVECAAWAKNMDAPESRKRQFCDCLVLAVTASAPTVSELEKINSDFGIPALQQFGKRPQGAQDFGKCFG